MMLVYIDSIREKQQQVDRLIFIKNLGEFSDSQYIRIRFMRAKLFDYILHKLQVIPVMTGKVAVKDCILEDGRIVSFFCDYIFYSKVWNLSAR